MEKCQSKYWNCLYYSSNALSRAMTKMADEEFSTTGLAPSYAILLQIVIEKKGIHPKEVSQEMQLAPSTVTRLVEKLEHRGLLKRKNIGRVTEIYPTDEGMKLKSKINDAQANLYKRYTKALGKDFSQSLIVDINKASQKI